MRHRVRDAGRADHAGVRGDEEDRRGEDADVDLQDVEHRSRDAEVLDETEHGVVGEAALLRGKPEERLVLAVHEPDGQRRERDRGQREVDGEDGQRDEADGGRDRARRVASLLREVGDRLDPRVGDHRHRDREEELAPGRRHAPVDVLLQDRRAEDEDEADDHEQELRGEVDEREQDVDPSGLLDPDDVQQHERGDHDGADDDVPGVVPKRRPEDREVVRDEERRDGDRDDVVQHLGPGRPEADELVEGVAREARRPAGLRVAHRPLRVGRGGRREDDPGDDEDERGQAKRERRCDAEGVVDGRADVAVGRREERRGPEHTLQTLRTSPPADDAPLSLEGAHWPIGHTN